MRAPPEQRYPTPRDKLILLLVESEIRDLESDLRVSCDAALKNRAVRELAEIRELLLDILTSERLVDRINTIIREHSV